MNETKYDDCPVCQEMLENAELLGQDPVVDKVYELHCWKCHPGQMYEDWARDVGLPRMVIEMARPWFNTRIEAAIAELEKETS